MKKKTKNKFLSLILIRHTRLGHVCYWCVILFLFLFFTTIKVLKTMGQGTENCDRPTEVSVIRFVSRNRTIEEIAPKKVY